MLQNSMVREMWGEKIKGDLKVFSGFKLVKTKRKYCSDEQVWKKF